MWEGALRKIAVCMKFRFILANTGEQNGCSSGTRSDKQIESKISHVYVALFFYRVLLCLKALEVIGFTVLALYVEVGKRCHWL